MELRMSTCHFCLEPLHADDSKNMPDPEGEGRVHRQCQDESDQAAGVCRPERQPTRMVPRFYHEHEHQLKEAADGSGQPVTPPTAPPLTSARARARGLEQELERLAEEEKQRQLRSRELHAQLEEAKRQAHVEEHEENARGWAAALWLCLENGKAALRSASTLPPRGWNHVDSESEYEFTLFSGETVWLKVKHNVGAKPPEAALQLGWTPLSQYRVDAKGRKA